MKKLVILLMVVLSLALVSAGCGERNVESKNMDVPDGMTAVFAEDDFSGEGGSSHQTLYEMTAEDTAVAYELLHEREIDNMDDSFKSIDPYSIKFSDGKTYSFDQNFDYYNYSNSAENEFGCGQLTDEEAEALRNIAANYTDVPASNKPAYDMSGNPITVYYQEGGKWQSADLTDKAAKSVGSILNIEEPANVGEENSGNVLYYLDFHNGTAVTLYDDGFGEICVGADSHKYQSIIEAGDDPGAYLTKAVESAKLPDGTLDTIKEALSNPTETWQ